MREKNFIRWCQLLNRPYVLSAQGWLLKDFKLLSFYLFGYCDEFLTFHKHTESLETFLYSMNLARYLRCSVYLGDSVLLV